MTTGMGLERRKWVFTIFGGFQFGFKNRLLALYNFLVFCVSVTGVEDGGYSGSGLVAIRSEGIRFLTRATKRYNMTQPNTVKKSIVELLEAAPEETMGKNNQVQTRYYTTATRAEETATSITTFNAAVVSIVGKRRRI
ncbi:hypothetical protein L1987_34702 [Smallanthus sonchifolius]|uniref:Uncharacterized protein n=1 Tax=Smallanthus sonchifolius TaxID=185202 RepID=A0ACB9HTZ4_9ASTR|nr:hypothetical protein L1987_34702 [Smallanthus sonchifolius]